MLQQYHPALDNLIQLGKDRGWLSYEEVNNTIPDEMIEPEALDELLVTFDSHSIELVDELEFRARIYRLTKKNGRPSVNVPKGEAASAFRAMSVSGGEDRGAAVRVDECGIGDREPHRDHGEVAAAEVGLDVVGEPDLRLAALGPVHLRPVRGDLVDRRALAGASR